MVNSLTPTQAAVALMYEGVYGRFPDAAGFIYNEMQVETGALTLDQLAHTFVTVPEFQALHGHDTPAQLVEFMYENFLGRPADVAGMTFWTSNFSSLDKLVSSFATSTEAITHNANSLNKIADAIHGNSSSFPTGPVDNSPVTIVIHDTVTVEVPVPTEPTHVVSTTIDTTPYITGLKTGTTDFLAGSGIPANHAVVTLDHTDDIQMALGVTYRTGDVATPTTGADGLAHFQLKAGSQDGSHNEQGANPNRAQAALTWELNAGPGSLTDKSFQVWIDTDPSANANYVKFDPLAGGNDNVGDTHVQENTFNQAFAPVSMPNPAPGHYDVQIVEMVGGKSVASLHAVLDLVA